MIGTLDILWRQIKKALLFAPDFYLSVTDKNQRSLMSSVNIPFNLDNKQNCQQGQSTLTNPERLILNNNQIRDFYSYQNANTISESRFKKQELQQELCFKKLLLIMIISLFSITLMKSFIINLFHLSLNISQNFSLKNQEKKLIQDKLELEKNLEANKSFRNMKKIIKEEIKALDANEILIRFE